MATDASIEKRYQLVREQYAALGVNTDQAMLRLKKVAISMHCWQGDDVGGFESAGELSAGLAVTGNYPGKARTAGGSCSTGSPAQVFSLAHDGPYFLQFPS